MSAGIESNQIFKGLHLLFDDVGNDVGRPFLVEGDSVLLDLLCEPLLDWSHGGAFLHLSYLLEQTLRKLGQGGRTLIVVFFDALEGVWTDASHLLARRVVIEHIRSCTSIRVHTFSDWWSPEYNAWMDSTAPAFMVSGSGRVPAAAAGAQARNITLAPEAESAMQTLMLHHMAAYVRCIRSSELTFHGDRMLGLQLQCPSDEDWQAIQGFHKRAPAKLPPPSQLAKLTADADLIARLLADKAVVGGGVARLSDAYAIVQALKGGAGAEKALAAKDKLVEAAKLFCLHTVMVAHVPLSARALSLADAGKSDAAKRSIAFARLATPHLAVAVKHSAPRVAAKGDGGRAASACDVFDGRFLAALASMLDGASAPKALGLSHAMRDELKALWAVVAGEAGVATDFLPLLGVKELAPATDVGVDKGVAEAVSGVWEPLSSADIEKRVKARKSAKAAAAKAKKGTASLVTQEKEAWQDDEEEEEADVADAWDADDGGDDGDEPAAWDDDDDDEEEEKKEEDKATPAASGDDSKAVVHPCDNILTDTLLFRVDERMEERQLMHSDGATTNPAADKWNKTLAKKGEWMANAELSDGLISYVPPPETPREKKQADQYRAYMMKYAQSLEGGRLVLREVVVAGTSTEDKKAAAAAAKAEKKHHGKKGGGGGGKKGQIGGAERTAAIRQEVDAKERAAKRDVIDRLIAVAEAQGKTLGEKIVKLDSALESHSDDAAIPGLMQLLEWRQKAWREAKAQGAGFEDAVGVHTLVHDVFRRFKSSLSVANCLLLQRALIALGFETTAAEMAAAFVATHAGKYSLEEALCTEKASAHTDQAIGLSAARFQLEYCGPYMLRNVESAQDDRVVGFYPDKWQRRLLDIVDAEESALVVAPTSSGKTFISYYCMKQTLIKNKQGVRDKEKGVIVYVSPTKALVNQIAGDVYRHYGQVYGTLTPDLEQNVFQCEVLITVPDMLEMLLLSPDRADWTKRIKYIILDEVHCIGEKGGEYWERLIQLSRCPFLALSATVGNPDHFHAWIERVQAHRNRAMHIIVHELRWADLDKYMYLPADATPEITVETPTDDLHTYKPKMIRVRRMHPVTALDAGARGEETGDASIPSTLVFSPGDALSLYDAMCKVPAAQLSPELVERLAVLRPDGYFSSGYIDKSMAKKYESELRDELSAWLGMGLNEQVTAVLNALSGDVLARISKLESSFPSASDAWNIDFVRAHFLTMLCELHAEGKLPAVIFCFNRDLCEQLVLETLEKLEGMEKVVVEAEANTPEGKAKAAAKDAARKQAKRERDKAAKAKKKKGDDDDDPNAGLDAAAQDAATAAAAMDDDDDNFVDPRFSFVREGEQLSVTEMDWWLSRVCRKMNWQKTHPLIRALYRGIGVHHEALNKTYRDLVETLFRGKHIKVVVATASLAVGINMPCRTSVFCSDHKNLTPLEYNQMAGRAGRRGYDNVGNVVFFGVPPRKAFRLMTSPLKHLSGHFPVNTTLSLRVMSYLANVEDKKYFIDTVRPLLSTPFLDADQLKEQQDTGLPEKQAAYNMRFQLEYLSREDCSIDAAGKLVGMGALASHMHSAEPGNFALSALITSGRFDEICADFKASPRECCRDLLFTLSHFFAIVPLPSDVQRSDFPGKASKVILDPLPAQTLEVISTRAKGATKLFSDYARSFADCELRGRQDTRLPLSALEFPHERLAADKASLMGKLNATALPCAARSSFVALSGHGDTFSSLGELVRSVRDEIVVEGRYMPMPIFEDRYGRPLRFNAYALDFLGHGKLSLLFTENGLRPQNAWALLKQWQLLLKKLLGALEKVAEPGCEKLHYEKGTKVKGMRLRELRKELAKAARSVKDSAKRKEMFDLKTKGSRDDMVKALTEFEEVRRGRKCTCSASILCLRQLEKDFSTSFRAIGNVKAEVAVYD